MNVKWVELIPGLGSGKSSCVGFFCILQISLELGARIDMRQLQVQCNALYASEMAEYAFHSFQYSTCFKFQYYGICEGDYDKDTLRYGGN